MMDGNEWHGMRMCDFFFVTVPKYCTWCQSFRVTFSTNRGVFLKTEYGSWFETKKKKSCSLWNMKFAHFLVCVVDLVDLQNCSIPRYPNYNLNEVILIFAAWIYLISILIFSGTVLLPGRGAFRLTLEGWSELQSCNFTAKVWYNLINTWFSPFVSTVCGLFYYHFIIILLSLYTLD